MGIHRQHATVFGAMLNQRAYAPTRHGTLVSLKPTHRNALDSVLIPEHSPNYVQTYIEYHSMRIKYDGVDESTESVSGSNPVS